MRDYMGKATNLAEIRATCRYFPLDSDDLSSFYIDTKEARGVDVLQKLILDFEQIPMVYQQILFLGHIGAGKSTLLYQLEKTLSSSYYVIRFSVQDLLDINTITFSDLMCVMYERILHTFQDKLDDRFAILQRIYESWNNTITKETSSFKDYEMEIDAEGRLGLTTRLVKLMTRLISSIKVGSQIKETISCEIKNDINKYIEMLNDLIAQITKVESKPILLMFEDLEKISEKSANDIFILQSDYFHRIKTRMLLTTPIYLKYSLDFKSAISYNFTSYEICPMIAVIEKNSNHISSNGYATAIEIMKSIVYARVEEDLIDDETLTKIIKSSGGVFRDLFGMLCEASKNAQLNHRRIINEYDYIVAFNKLQEEYGNVITEEYLPIIEKVYRNPHSLVQNTNSFLKLMKHEIIIEYNCEQWRGIHPAVVEYVNNKKLLDLR